LLTSVIDHLVVTAGSRESGCAWIMEVLGVAPRPGGDHTRMGTHNALVRLGEALYLEVIAVNPAAATPSRARWFGMDRLATSAPPRLATWVVRTTDIDAAAARASVPLGSIEEMTRDSLTWRITIPDDGCVPLNGAAPSLIQWSGTDHPAAALPDVGCELESLEIRHRDVNALRALLREMAFDGPVVLSPAESGRSDLTARIRTPAGPRVLGEP
jgi:hypothetical protein